jgi:hypothetical protein
VLQWLCTRRNWHSDRYTILKRIGAFCGHNGIAHLQLGGREPKDQVRPEVWQLRVV